MKNLQFNGIIKLLSPLSHNSDENYGTDTVFRKSKIKVGDSFEDIPVLSGNGIRGVLRRLIADDYLKLLGLTDVNEKLFYILFAGGALEGMDSNLEVKQIKDIRKNISLISLLGTAFSTKMIKGKLKVGMGMLICEETKPYTEIESDKSFVEFIDEIFYTRRDDKEDKTGDKAHQMKYSGEVLIPGTELSHFFMLQNVDALEESCFYRTIKLFNNNPFLGGKSQVGHGKVRLEYDWNLDDDLYLKYIEEHKKQIIKFLSECVK